MIFSAKKSVPYLYTVWLGGTCFITAARSIFVTCYSLPVVSIVKRLTKEDTEVGR